MAIINKLETTKVKDSQYTRSLIEASLDPLITISAKGKIMDMNEALANITGITREKLTGTDFLDYFTEPQKARAVYQEVFANGSVTDSPLTLRHKNGALTDVLFNGSVYKNDKGDVLGVVIVARDSTDQKRIATELREAKEFAEMATTIAEEAKTKAENATRIAEEATRIAEDAVKSKQQFLSNMSHEIRTPMNAIIGFTKVVLKTELTIKQKEYLTAIKTSGDALVVLINDILDLAKVDAGKMTFEQRPFKMSVSISSMLHLFELKIEEKNLLLVKEYDQRIPDVLLGDPVRLHQIILNLVSNAVKFTKEGKITVHVKLLDENDKTVNIQFVVSDTGIGMSEDQIPTVFDNFKQAYTDTSRLYGGTGLGLAIVKQLVEAQGGMMSVKSKVDVGSEFSFVLTFQKTTAEAEAEVIPIEANIEIKNTRVLVAEDVALNQLLIRTLLDDFGFKCDIVSNGRIAIEKMQANEYDIILMDLQMPEMNGFEATEYIRKELNSKIPILALTADVTSTDLDKCKSIGMDDYISKPIDEGLLQSKIIFYLAKASMNKMNEEKGGEPMSTKIKFIDLTYLSKRTKQDPQLMTEMISLYLGQTTSMIREMKEGLKNKDWKTLKAIAHKMIPSFSIVGIHTEFEDVAKQLQEYASQEKNLSDVPGLVAKLENVLGHACEELEVEFNLLKERTNED
jgi:PAS domain S-box-containing protein